MPGWLSRNAHAIAHPGVAFFAFAARESAFWPPRAPIVLTRVWCSQERNRMHIIMELCTGGSLVSRMKQHRHGYGERQAARLVQKMLSAIYYCHQALEHRASTQRAARDSAPRARTRSCGVHTAARRRHALLRRRRHDLVSVHFTPLPPAAQSVSSRDVATHLCSLADGAKQC
eukprot:6183058-Pleurochrysis_carterae.AAC.1